MKKIGILIESANCGKYLYETVSELSKSGNIELFFLLSSGVLEQRNIFDKLKFKIKANGLFRTFELSLFKIISYIEYKILSIFYKDIKNQNTTFSIDNFIKNKIIHLNPIYSANGLIVRYPDEDIDKIKSLGLDLIIRGNAFGIFKGKIINCAKDGIISFHHGDNRWNRGGPAAFWEVYLRKHSTGFIIQILNEELNAGEVIFRGNIPTQRSYTENIVSLYKESNPYIAKIILEYAFNNKFPPKEEKLPFGCSILKAPSFIQSISYLLRTGALFLLLAIKRLILRKHKRWNVAYIKSCWHNANLKKGTRIKNPRNRFFADPFVITKEDKTVCYVEDYCYKQKRASITAIELINDKNYAILGTVIQEPFHMSFPFLFEYKKELYMVPETIKANSIRLYKCVKFPLKWEYQKDILTNISAADTMIFEHNGKWQLLCNMNIAGQQDHCSTLYAFYNKSPLADNWTAHESNPLIFNSNIARNGGLLNVSGKIPIRVRQKQGFNFYGKSLTLAKITDLSPSSFKEEEIGRIYPDFFNKIIGCHHIHSNDVYSVYDYLKIDSLK
ncbi:MAG: hypothetical protein JRJ44_02240 [Deltaproteobacteria bacterium]|nr:hypothetical protein [Deltaproteobacteria bacterium]